MYDSTKCDVSNTCIADGDRIVLWTIQGRPGYYPSKLIAEAVVRSMFPNEVSRRRYARIGFVHFIKEP